MSDPSARWLTDPTGRHDHRYWDGRAWTEHVADAGVAGIDPYDAPPPPPPPPAPLEEPLTPADDRPPDATATQELAAVEETGPEADDDPFGAEPGPEPAAAGEPEETASLLLPGVGEHPTAELPTTASTGAEDDTLVGPSYGDDTLIGGTSLGGPTAATPWAGPAAGAPTEELPVAPTEARPDWSDPSASPTPEQAPFTPAAVPGSSHAGLAIGVGLLALVAIVVALVVLIGGGDDDDNSASAIAERMAAKLQQEEGLRRDDARCVADRLVDELGTDRLAAVDFDADEPPKELQDDINTAFPKAIAACQVGGPSTFEDQDDLDSYLEQLADSFLSMYGLTSEQAQCLARAMTPALGSPPSEGDAFGQFKEDLAACGISSDDLAEPTP